MKKYKIGLFGFGCVGQGLHEALSDNPQVAAEIVKICVKNLDKERPLSKDKFVFDPKSILEDEDIDLIVELIDDAKLAFEIVSDALRQRKPVISANKKMVAENLDKLIALQQEYDTPILYEGAVCGSIPIIKTLTDYYSLENVLEIKGIFNGSTNYILTKVIEENKSYKEALEAAQVNGFAETDPTLDVEGYDAKYKLSIVIEHAFGVHVHPDNIFNQGIQDITKSDITFAKERGLKIKLLAKAVKYNNYFSAYVAPHFVSKESPLYHVENEYNAVLVQGAFADDQVLVGKGAGKLPTGLAVLSDVNAIANNYRYSQRQVSSMAIQSTVEEVYVSFSPEQPVNFNLFTNVSEKYIGQNSGYVIGEINTDSLQELLTNADTNVIFTSGAKEEIEIHRLTYSYEIG
ncbi:homoserine dehydrogenase [Fulvivirga sp. M361]|uniref:homoserine dehydrogenase n=1 Tax=Fulvivirga sp. M361 TaxID=2594266 RepID=UPI00117BC969|nr:homoserine dehydrogenase [Fulvivirga sp. M361]TRX61357.1 homoserine dehydrogenase [Fulvivirga sp. M361]